MKNNSNKIIAIVTILIIFLINGIIVFKIVKNNKLAPQEVEIKSICELATIKAYYHNVAKGSKEKSSGISGVGEKNREFWMEYEGYANIGIDVSKVKIKVYKNIVKVEMPPAKVLDTNITTNTDKEDIRIIESGDGFFNKNKITTNDRQAAFENAQKDMKKSVENNKSLMQSAETRAKELIENYIQEIGNSIGKEYIIEWEIVEEKNTEK